MLGGSGVALPLLQDRGRGRAAALQAGLHHSQALKPQHRADAGVTPPSQTPVRGVYLGLHLARSQVIGPSCVFKVQAVGTTTSWLCPLDWPIGLAHHVTSVAEEMDRGHESV